MTDAAVIILAGGKSSRMGSDKARLPWHGARLVDYVAGVCKEAGLAEIFVSGAVEGYGMIPDTLPHKGPVGGICTSIRQLPAQYEWLLFVPVDMPHLSGEIIHTLLRQRKNHDACYFEGHPLPCLLHVTEYLRAYTERIRKSLSGGEEYSVRRYLEDLDAWAVPVSSAVTLPLTNTNTPEQWQEAQRGIAP